METSLGVQIAAGHDYKNQDTSAIHESLIAVSAI
jgi:hypothetical protein